MKNKDQVLKTPESVVVALSCVFQGQFYNIGQHQEPPFSAPAFALPPENNNMLYIGMSAFTVNSAAFVYHNAGALSMYITDDMVSPALHLVNQPAQRPTNLSVSAPTDSQKLPHPPQHQNVWNFHPRGEQQSLAILQSPGL